MRSLDRKRAAGVPAAPRQRSTDAAAGDHDLVMESGPFGNDASGQRRIRHSERADARIAQHDRAVPAAEFDRNARENQTERDLDPSRLRRPTISALRMRTPNGVTAAGGHRPRRDGRGQYEVAKSFCIKAGPADVDRLAGATAAESGSLASPPPAMPRAASHPLSPPSTPCDALFLVDSGDSNTGTKCA